eukprot:scaffold51231_cov30-Tisochrysis_lutea.AAC.2
MRGAGRRSCGDVARVRSAQLSTCRGGAGGAREASQHLPLRRKHMNTAIAASRLWTCRRGLRRERAHQREDTIC